MGTRDALLDLIESFKKMKEDEEELRDTKIIEFINILYNDKCFIKIMDDETVYESLEILFEEVKSKSKQNNITPDAFLSQLKKGLEINIAHNFILIPILGAELSKTLEISNEIAFIAGSRDKKIKEIARLTELKVENVKEHLEHTERSRSEHLLKHPMMLFRVTHHFNVVNQAANYLTYNIINFIKLIYYSYVNPNYKKEKTLGLFNSIKEENEQKTQSNNKHIVILSEKNNRNQPIWFEHKFNYKLDWLEDEKFSNMLLSLINIINLKNIQTELNLRFLKSIRFFNKSLISSQNSYLYDIEAEAILMLTIASEIVLIEGQEEKKKTKKIRNRLTRLVNYSDLNYNKEQIHNHINKMYNVRNEYVHEGRYHGLSKDSIQKEDAEIFRKILGRFLCEADKYNSNVLKKSKELNKPQNEIWKKIITGEL